MAVSVIKRPQGHILDSTVNSAQIFNSSGEVMFYKQTHGLSNSNYVYIISETSEYNGFWYVDVVDVDYFRIREYATASNVSYINTFSATCTYYKFILNHGFSCVHLPITYKLSNTAWPTNSIDTARTETGTVDNNGLCEITVDGDIKTTGSADELDYIEVQTGSLAGVYQIIEWTSDTVFTLNIPYSAANDTALSGATLQYYYNNYTVRVKVFAGNNTWTTLKPMEEIAVFDIVPDTDNIVNININELLKEKIKVISNDLTLGTLPNDIDSFCEFYISTAETYDTTDGSKLTTSTPSYTSDESNLTGVAVNSKLQFKNRHSGYLSEYLAYNSYSKFLTLFEEPRYFIGSYYDISFLVLNNSIYTVRREAYLNSVLQSTSYEDVLRSGKGLYRYPLSLPSGSLEDRVDLTLMFNQSVPAFSTANWFNGGNPAYRNWLIADASLTLTTALPDGKIFYTAFTPIPLISYSITYNIDLTDASNELTELYFGFYDASFNLSAATAITTTGTGNYSGTLVLKVSEPFAYPDPIYFGVTANASSIAGADVVVDIATISWGTVDYSETKTINVDSECSFQDIYLTWKNYLGGMDYWKFTAQKDYITDIEGTTETTDNIFPTWPNSYGEFADTIDKETSRTSRNKITVRSQNMTEEEMNAVRYIVSSPLVQIVVSRTDRRTVIVSTGSFTWKRDEDKLYAIEFEISYTDPIPSQSL